MISALCNRIERLGGMSKIGLLLPLKAQKHTEISVDFSGNYFRVGNPNFESEYRVRQVAFFFQSNR